MAKTRSVRGAGAGHPRPILQSVMGLTLGPCRRRCAAARGAHCAVILRSFTIAPTGCIPLHEVANSFARRGYDRPRFLFRPPSRRVA